jgi:hypothetical protein
MYKMNKQTGEMIKLQAQELRSELYIERNAIRTLRYNYR